jgi:hypothetical protein
MDKKAHLEAMRKRHEEKERASQSDMDIDAVVSQQTKDRLEKVSVKTQEAARIASEKGKVAARVATEKSKVARRVLAEKGGAVWGRLSSSLTKFRSEADQKRAAIHVHWKLIGLGSVVVTALGVGIYAWQSTPRRDKSQPATNPVVVAPEKPIKPAAISKPMPAPLQVVEPVPVEEPIVASEEPAVDQAPEAKAPSATNEPQPATVQKPVMERSAPKKIASKKNPPKKAEPESDWRDKANNDLDTFMENQ